MRETLAAGVGLQATTVRARNRERRESLAATRMLEVPAPGITLEVLDGPMDGALLCGDPERIRIGRAPGNDLELHADRSVSGEHAVLVRVDGEPAWRLEDLHSTNGTWMDGVRLSAPQPLAFETEFMVGHSVLWLTPGARDQSFLPDFQTLRQEMARLTAGFAPETAEGYGAAVALAAGEQRPYLTDRHLFLGLLAMNPDLPLLSRNQGPVTPRFLTETLRRNEHWSGPKAWINRQLRALAMDVVTLFKDDLTATPRLLRLLVAAESAAREAGAPAVRPVDVLRAFLAGPANRPRDLLAREGVAPADLLALLDRPGGPTTPERTQTRARPPVAAAPVAPPPTPQVTTGSHALDSRAQDTARGLYGVASLYHLAASEDRYLAMRQFLVQEISQVPADSRPVLLGQLRRLFPIVAGASAPDMAEMTHMHAERNRKRAAKAEPPPPQATAGTIPWRPLLESAQRPDLAALAPPERAAAELFIDLFNFATAIERWIVSVVQSLRSPGVGTGTLQLPGARTSIQRFARDLVGGKSPKRETLQEYMTSVETWLVAALAAYHEGPELWFKDFWRKINPTAIEHPLAEENRKKLLPGLSSLEYWNRYKERVRSVRPDLISDEIQQTVRRRLDEQYHQLIERRKPS